MSIPLSCDHRALFGGHSVRFGIVSCCKFNSVEMLIQGMFYMLATRRDFPSVLINLSAVAFAWGHSGDLSMVKPHVGRKPAELLTEGGAVVCLRVPGMPSIEKILSMTGITEFAEVECMTSTTGYREYSSTLTSKCSPVGSGP